MPCIPAAAAVPTAQQQGVSTDAAAMRSDLVLQELALLDYSMLKYKYSTVAAAALLAAHQRRGAAFDLPLLLSVAPYVADESAQACAAALLALHEQCWSDVLLPGMEHFEVLRRRHELRV